jgi:excisionase family DNA binding protein
MEDTELITTDELAGKLKVPKSWVYNQTKYIGPGCMPRIKAGKYLRFNYAEVVEWLRKKTEEGMSN